MSSPRWDFSRETVERISAAKHEPPWMRRARLAAWDALEDPEVGVLPPELDLSKMVMFADPPAGGVPVDQWPKDLSHALAERGDEEGLIIQRDATILSRSITKDAFKRGVVFSDLDTAARREPDLVQRLWGETAPAQDALACLARAFWSGGCLLYVPEFVQVVLPFHVCRWLSTPDLMMFPITLVVAERGSRVMVVDEELSGHWDSPSASAGRIQFRVAEDARVDHVHLQNWGRQVAHWTRQEASVAPRGRLHTWSAAMGGRAERVALTYRCQSPESSLLQTAVAESAREGTRVFEPLLSLLPEEPLREKVRYYLQGKLTGSRPEVTLQQAAQWHPEVRV